MTTMTDPKTTSTATIWLNNEPLHVTVDALSLEDISVAAELCMDGPANFQAMELARKFADGRTKALPAAVYVIQAEDMPICKIGIAGSPWARLRDLQVANWRDLSVAALIWSDTWPLNVEQTALAAARDMGIRLRGEWINAEPKEACELVLKASRYCKMPVCDSATWMDNWAIRTHAVAEAKGRLGAIEKLPTRCKKSAR